MKKEEITELIKEVEKLKETDPENIIYIDSLELLKMAHMLLEKFEASKPNYYISFGRGDWGDDSIPLGRLKSFLENLKYSDIIEHLTFALGGNGFFTVINKLGFVKSLEEVVNEVKENLGKSTEKVEEEIMETLRTDIIKALEEFKVFLEKDGFLAFWKDKKVGGKLKNQPEEIGKSQVMAFLTGRGTGYIAREVPAGKGFQDIIFVEDPKSPIIIETKVIKDKGQKYEEGKSQLKDYINKNNHNDGYYVIFQTKDIYKEESFEENGITINQIVININQEAPTKKFREKK